MLARMPRTTHAALWIRRTRMTPRSYSKYRLSTAADVLKGSHQVAHRMIRALLRRSHFTLAERMTARLAHGHGQDAALQHVLAALRWARDDIPGALDASRNAVALEPRNQRHRVLHASVHNSAGDVARALSVLGDERPNHEPVQSLRLRITLHLARRDLHSALRLARMAYRRFPGLPEPARLLITALIETGNFAEADALCARACTDSPSNRIFWHLRAQIHERLGDLRVAREALAHALSLDPDDLRALEADLRLQVMQSDQESARERARAFTDRIDLASFPNKAALLRLFDTVQLDPPSALLEHIARQECDTADAALGAFSASIALSDKDMALRAFDAILSFGTHDTRLLGPLKMLGDTLDPEAAGRGLPTPSWLLRKLEAAGLRQTAGDPLLAAADDLTMRILHDGPSEGDAPRVSFICPIHRAQDVSNLLAQINRQRWPDAEVIFCVNGEGIDPASLRPDPSTGFPVRHLVLPPGKTIGHYLNKAIDLAEGDVVVRFDADDRYAADYTRCMVGFLLASEADIVSMSPYCFHFESLGQTYLLHPPSPEIARDLGAGNRQAIGSGSSLCARRRAFATVRFDETLRLGEDVNFYRRAIASGLRVCGLPGHFHTAKRRVDKTAHTWKVADANMIASDSLYLGEGCVILRPGECAAPPADDPFCGLFEDPAFVSFAELRAEAALRSIPGRLRILRGPNTPLPNRAGPYLDVALAEEARRSDDALCIVVAPDDPALEDRVAERHGGLSFTRDIVPRLACRDRVAFARAGGITRADRNRFAQRFEGAGTRYAILANPRSGSEHLCALLASVGLGRPAEHFRAPLIAALACKRAPDGALREVFGQIEHEGVVGTKLLTQYLFEPAAGDAGDRLLGWMVDAGFCFVRVGRRETESAVSSYVAEALGVWHHENRAGPRSALKEAPATMPPYDFAALSAKFRRYAAWTRQLDDAVGRLIPDDKLIRINYAQVARRPKHTLRRVAEFLEAPFLPGMTPISRLVPATTRAPEIRAYRERFAQDLALGGVPNDAAKRTG
ncbi:glycosyltransferase [Limibaculum sp. M0105]|uniref:Glycosyltransferase n=2 Tax=Thermohalobaculum xanthum TaxID=2753746 RepID=A0A8J7M939_9RHOB|nr:glycosyltransferase [Thermohalobaculum xanthum]